MIDENFDRHYQAGRAEMNAALGNLFGRLSGAIGDSFKVLHRIEWSAPWNQTAKSRRHH